MNRQLLQILALMVWHSSSFVVLPTFLRYCRLENSVSCLSRVFLSDKNTENDDSNEAKTYSGDRAEDVEAMINALSNEKSVNSKSGVEVDEYDVNESIEILERIAQEMESSSSEDSLLPLDALSNHLGIDVPKLPKIDDQYYEGMMDGDDDAVFLDAESYLEASRTVNEDGILHSLEKRPQRSERDKFHERILLSLAQSAPYSPTALQKRRGRKPKNETKIVWDAIQKQRKPLSEAERFEMEAKAEAEYHSVFDKEIGFMNQSKTFREALASGAPLRPSNHLHEEFQKEQDERVANLTSQIDLFLADLEEREQQKQEQDKDKERVKCQKCLCDLNQDEIARWANLQKRKPKQQIVFQCSSCRIRQLECDPESFEEDRPHVPRRVYRTKSLSLRRDITRRRSQSWPSDRT